MKQSKNLKILANQAYAWHQAKKLCAGPEFEAHALRVRYTESALRSTIATLENEGYFDRPEGGEAQVKVFLSEVMDAHLEGRIKASAAFLLYCEWMAKTRPALTPMSLTAFGRRMRKVVSAHRTMHGVFYSLAVDSTKLESLVKP